MVSGSLRATDTLYSTTAQFQILRAPTASNGTTYGPGTANNLLKSNGNNIYWTTLSANDIPTISITDKTSGTLTVARGGTGATDATGARTNLGVKALQSNVSSPTASGNSISYIDTISQNTQGVISATKKTIPEVTQSESGLMIPDDKIKLDDIETKKQVKTVSIEPVQDLHGYESPWIGTDVDKQPYLFRTISDSSVQDKGTHEMDKLVGGTVAWNQMIQNGNFTNTSGWVGMNATISTSNGVISAVSSQGDGFFGFRQSYSGSVKTGHVYLLSIEGKASVENLSVYNPYFYNTMGSRASGATTTLIGTSWHTLTAITRAPVDADNATGLGIRKGNGSNAGEELTIYGRNAQIFDLTQMFGTTIADYIYSLEQTTEGAGVVWFRKLFPASYYPYNAGQLMSVKTSAHVTRGFNQWDEEWEYGNISESNGQNISDGYTAFWRSKNYIPVIPSAVYCHYTNGYNGNFRHFFYDENKNFISFSAPAATENKLTFSIPTGAYFMRFRYSTNLTNYKNCINISKTTGTPKNGDYVAYDGHTYALDSDLELRGIPKLDSNNNLYYDGDIYEASGNVTRKYGIVDLGTLNWGLCPNCTHSFQVQINEKKFPSKNAICHKYHTSSEFATDASIVTLEQTKDKILYTKAGSAMIDITDSLYTDAATFKTAMSGVYLVYELKTPTTETADPFTSTQVINLDGTEEYVDTRTVAIPVGHESNYANICPIEGWTGTNVAVTSINIWDEETEFGQWNDNLHVWDASAAQLKSKNYIPIKPATTYRLTNPTGTISRYVFYDANKNYMSWTSANSNSNFITPANSAYMMFGLAASYGTTYNHNVSINYPATDTTYHPYIDTTIPITFPTEAGTVYSGTLDAITGLLTVDRAIVTFNGTENILMGSSSYIKTDACDAYFILQNMPRINTGQTPSFGLCNYLKAAIQGIWSAVGYPNMFVFNNQQLHLNFANNLIGVEDPAQETTSSAIAKIKAWLKQLNDNGEPLTVIYPLVTPVTYQLTPTEILLLTNEDNVWADTGEVTLQSYFINNATNVTGTVAVSNGGTNLTSTTQGGIVYGSSSNAYAMTSAGTAGQFLKSNDVNAPTWNDITYPDIKPTISRIYSPSESYGSADSEAKCVFFFMSIKPDSWYKPWQVRFKIRTACDSYANVDSITWATLNGRADGFIYHNWNERYDTGHYYTTIRTLKNAGFNAGLGHMVGANVRYSTGRGNTAYTRKFYIDYYECENCTVTLLDNANLWENLGNTTNYSDTNYNGYSNMDAVNRGLRETGDDNTTSISTLYEQYGGWTAGNNLKRYQFVFQSAPNSTNLVTLYEVDNKYDVTNKTLLDIDFDPLGRIFFYNTTGTNNTGTNIDPGRLYNSIVADLRYTFNVTSTTSSTTFTGVRYTSLFLKTSMVSTTGMVHVASNQPLVTSLPTNNDGYYYIYLGQVHDWYRVYITNYHPVFYHNGTSLVRYYGKEIGGNAATATTLSSTLPVTLGGTGATTAAQARTNLEITPANIGAVAKSGDTMTGLLTISHSNARTTYNDGTRDVLWVGKSNVANAYVGLHSLGYYNENGSWTDNAAYIAYRAPGGNIYLNGRADSLPDRTLTIGSTGKTFNGTGNVSWSLAEIGATVSNTWTNGTTAGPTIKTTVNGVTGTAVAIPSASSTQSGIITTDEQTFSGAKYFNVPNFLYVRSTGNTVWPGISFGTTAVTGSNYTTTAQDQWNTLLTQVAGKKNSDGTYYQNRFFFRSYSDNGAGSRINHYEDYYLPLCDRNRTADKSYNILTTKDMSFSITGNAANVTGVVNVINGGTGANTPAGAKNNLGLGSAAMDFSVVNYQGDLQYWGIDAVVQNNSNGTRSLDILNKRMALIIQSNGILCHNATDDSGVWALHIVLSKPVSGRTDANGNINLGISAVNFIVIGIKINSYIAIPWASGADNNWHARIIGITGTAYANVDITATVYYKSVPYVE